ncbi:MAG: hypothetical protein KAV87_50850, partial [Desulfobacteraceae bacterium]|nr:hypothetical protein [Desulfobacteraceae bacterium]
RQYCKPTLTLCPRNTNLLYPVLSALYPEGLLPRFLKSLERVVVDPAYYSLRVVHEPSFSNRFEQTWFMLHYPC